MYYYVHFYPRHQLWMKNSGYQNNNENGKFFHWPNLRGMGGIQEIRRVNKNSLEMEFEMSEMEHAYIDASEISRYSQELKPSRLLPEQQN